MNTPDDNGGGQPASMLLMFRVVKMPGGYRFERKLDEYFEVDSSPFPQDVIDKLDGWAETGEPVAVDVEMP